MGSGNEDFRGVWVASCSNLSNDHIWQGTTLGDFSDSESWKLIGSLADPRLLGTSSDVCAGTGLGEAGA
ncbi:hypothetical protein PISMIDRAFT_688073 [Pisolithus microcarpus 441]|uniref:Uncharacterized protein n=1 Tax=Pisolithus microcarpus 441 TaxID=765257 RepID=A0A0C9YC17_9AGAM|nr:hypothetical protein PISMIDRAFT_688073 [Pisolithus microcarpus 441]